MPGIPSDSSVGSVAMLNKLALVVFRMLGATVIVRALGSVCPLVLWLWPTVAEKPGMPRGMASAGSQVSASGTGGMPLSLSPDGPPAQGMQTGNTLIIPHVFGWGLIF